MDKYSINYRLTDRNGVHFDVCRGEYVVKTFSCGGRPDEVTRAYANAMDFIEERERVADTVAGVVEVNR